MVSRQSFINKLREQNYTYKNQLKRTYMWKKKGGTHMVFVPMTEFLDDEWVQSQLGQMGCTAEEIKSFISMCHN